MRKLIVTLAAVVALAGCTNAEKGAVVGGLGGAAVGGLVTGDTAGAAVGGLIGAAGGYLIGKTADGRCRYRDPDTGEVYIDRC